MKTSKKFIAIGAVILMVVGVVLLFSVNTTTSTKGVTKKYIIDAGTSVDQKWDGLVSSSVIFDGEKNIPTEEDILIMKSNTSNFQRMVDEASKTSGEVLIPEGNFYFYASGTEKDGQFTPSIRRGDFSHVILCKDNVTIIGAGKDKTFLRPYGHGTKEHNTGGLDMFYYNDYGELYDKEKEQAKGKGKFLKNNTFMNFTIDGSQAVGEHYTSAGKGFMINLFENCFFDNINVYNTDGTGFGIDCPINSTIMNCHAENCGKLATTDDAGASGFGIGTGYSNDENIKISNCTAVGNKKFGFFFEHQSRFTEIYPATKANGFIVENCVAKNNLHDFGGAKANDVLYLNCKSDTQGDKLGGFFFEPFAKNRLLTSTNVDILNCTVSQVFEDANTPEFKWAKENGIATGVSRTSAKPDDIIKRQEFMTFFWRWAGQPGEVSTTLNGAINLEASDVESTSVYAAAFKWGIDNGIITLSQEDGNTVRPEDEAMRIEVLAMLHKYSGAPKVEYKNKFPDCDESKWYHEIVNWAAYNKIIDDSTGTPLKATEKITRGESIKYLYNFDKNASTKCAIRYYLDGGAFNEQAPESYYSKGDKDTVIPAPVKEGFVFAGWTGSNGVFPEENLTISKLDSGNKAYIANWSMKIPTFTVTVNHFLEEVDGTYKDGKDGREFAPKTERYEVIKNSNYYPPLLADYTGFEKPFAPSEIKVTKDTTVDYYYPRKEFKVNVSMGEGISKVENAGKHKYGTDVSLTPIIKLGYENPVWTGDFNSGTFKMPAKPVTLSVKATPKTYTITYNLNDGQVESNPTQYTVESDEIVLNQPTKENNVFQGWIGTDLAEPTKEVVIPKGSTGNRTYTATWSDTQPGEGDCTVVVYHYTQNVDGTYDNGKNGRPNNPAKVDTFENQKQGEIFKIIPHDFGEGFAKAKPEDKEIPMGINLLNISISYGRNSYQLRIIKGEGIEAVNNKDYYFYDEDVNLSANCLEGYKNPQWKGYLDTNVFKMPATPIVMSVQAEAINYKINYDLDGGSFTEGTNPSVYTVNTPDITLNNPTKEGYEFIGWKDEEGNVSLNTVIPKGSLGDRTYIAQWKKRDLSKAKITLQHYKQNINGTYSETPFEVEDVYITIGTYYAPTYKDYEGFSKPPEMDELLIGDDCIIYCNYPRNKYTLNLTVGEGILSTNAKAEYLYEEKVVLNPTLKPGYENPYVSGDANSLEFQMPAKPANITVAATPINYSINIDLNNGYFDVEVPTNFNVNSEDIVIPEPKKDNAKFLGWIVNDGTDLVKNYTIQKGTLENVKLTARWENLSEDVYYTVTHWKSGFGEDDYPDELSEVEDFHGKKGDKVTIQPKEYEGFNSPEPVEVVLDNDTNYDLFYKRRSYKVTIMKGEGILQATAKQSCFYGEEVEVTATPKKGYSNVRVNGMPLENKIYMPDQELVLNITAEPIVYSITYELNGGTVTGNPESYRVFDSDITLINPTKEGYDFIGWTGGNGITTPQMNVVIPQGSTSDLNFVANWKEEEIQTPDPEEPEITEYKYVIEHYKENINGTYNEEPDEKFEGKAKKDSEIVAKVNKYKGFTSPNEEKVKLDNNKIIRYYYTRNSYKLKIKTNNGIEEVLAKDKYKYGEKVNIEANNLKGYSDPIVSGDFNKLTFIMPDKDVNLKIESFIEKYKIQYDLNGGFAYGNPKEYTVESEKIVLNNPTRGRLQFLGWQDGTGRNLGTYVVIPKGSTGNRYYKALWEEKDTPPTIITTVVVTVEHYKQNVDGSYSKYPTQTEKISAIKGSKIRPAVKNYPGYASPQVQEVEASDGLVIKYRYEIKKHNVLVELGNGINSVNGNTSYKAGEDVELSANVKEGYENPVWSGDFDTNRFKMPNKDVNMKVTASPIQYNIDYDLAGGKLAKENPNTYTIESDDITLNKPTKENYKFVGWRENDSLEAIEDVVIRKGSLGDKSYTAVWEKLDNVVNYEVKHYKENLDGTYDDGENDTPADVDNLQANIDDEVEPLVKTYEGFKSPEIKKVKVANGTVVKYYYERNTYNVKVDKGSEIEDISGEGEYKFEEKVTLSANPKEGYKGVVWAGDFNENEFTMPAKDVFMYAKANLIEYDITYDLDGGILDENNPSKYTVESDDILLNNPTKDGYEFVGWKDINTNNVDDEMIITSGSIGNKSFVAIWKEKEIQKYELVVKHVKEDLEGNFDETDPEDTEEFEVEEGTKVTPEVKNYEGFNSPDAKVIVVDQNLTLTYKYTRKTYKLNVEYGNGITKVNNSDKYKYGEKVKLDFDFEKGYGNVEITGDYSKDEFNMPAKDVNIHAEASIVKYMIDYELNGGKLNKANPTEYTIQTDDIKLNNPVKKGFRFVGWYEEGDDYVSDKYVIKKGSTGDKTFIAKWTNIDLKPDEGGENENENNPNDKPGNNDNDNNKPNNNKPDNNNDNNNNHNDNNKPNNKPNNDKPNNNNKPDNNEKGDDLADKDIPHAGKSVAIVILISVASAFGIIKFVDYNRYRKY